MQKIFAVLVLALLVACAKEKQVEPAQKPVATFSEFQKFAEETNATKEVIGCAKDCQKLRQEFRYVAYVGKQIYCYWDRKQAESQTDFTELAKKLEASITDNTSATEYYKTLRRWAAAFHDGHVNVMAKDDMSSLEIFTTPDVRLEALAPATDHEKVIVSVSKVAGLQVGDEVVALNDLPIQQALSEAEKESSGSTARMRRFWGVRRLVDVLGIDTGTSNLKLKIARDSKEFILQRKIELNAVPVKAADAAEPTGLENLKVSILPGNIGYLRIDAFTGSQDDALLDQAMDRLAKTSSLIIDLRQNGGGDLSGDKILARLTKSPISRYVTSENLNPFTLALRPSYALLTPSIEDTGFATWMPKQVQPKSYYGDKNVVALISPACFSACDTFSAGLKANHLAVMVGEPTGGGTGTPLVFDLPVSEHKFRYAIVRGKTVDGNWIEGNGTQPDVLVEPTPADRKDGKDRALEAAIDLAKKPRNATPVTPVNTADAASRLVTTFNFIGDQSLDVSATQAEHQNLKKVFRVDEI